MKLTYKSWIELNWTELNWTEQIVYVNNIRFILSYLNSISNNSNRSNNNNNNNNKTEENLKKQTKNLILFCCHWVDSVPFSSLSSFSILVFFWVIFYSKCWLIRLELDSAWDWLDWTELSLSFSFAVFFHFYNI